MKNERKNHGLIGKERGPHVGPHHLGHIGHRARHNVVSILYEQEKMEAIYGKTWSYHLEKIGAEPPEMKMLFALQMGFKVEINTNIMDQLKELYQYEREYKFVSPALDESEETIEIIASKLGISAEDANIILGFAPEGVLSIVMSVAICKNNIWVV